MSDCFVNHRFFCSCDLDHPETCRCGNDLTDSEAENGWECAACRWESDQDARADQ